MQRAFTHIYTELAGLYSAEEIASIARLLISNITGFNFTEILINKNTIFSAHQRNLLENYLKKLKINIPVQYVLGETEFCGLHFILDESVLIPRQETEELVEWVVREVNPRSSLLDIGTGSGCIAISLKSLLPESHVMACDVSEKALQTAQKNAIHNKLNVHFFEMDILLLSDADNLYDVIVSNPPYVPQHEFNLLSPRVKDYEPHLALFVPDDDPLLFYRKIARFARQHLYPGGKLFFEIHRDFGEACVHLLHDLKFVQVRLKKDIAGNDRMICAEVSS